LSRTLQHLHLCSREQRAGEAYACAVLRLLRMLSLDFARAVGHQTDSLGHSGEVWYNRI